MSRTTVLLVTFYAHTPHLYPSVYIKFGCQNSNKAYRQEWEVKVIPSNFSFSQIKWLTVWIFTIFWGNKYLLHIPYRFARVMGAWQHARAHCKHIFEDSYLTYFLQTSHLTNCLVLIIFRCCIHITILVVDFFLSSTNLYKFATTAVPFFMMSSS